MFPGELSLHSSILTLITWFKLLSGDLRVPLWFKHIKSTLALVLLLLTLPFSTQAHDYQAGQLHIAHPSSRTTPPGVPNGVAYLTVHHQGDRADQLLSATTPRADRVQLHRSAESNGMSTMEHISLPYRLEPGSELKLQQGGYHFMLMGLTKPLTAGERIPLTLTFERAGTVEVELVVEDLLGDSDRHAHE